MAGTVKCNSCNIVIDELLSYVQNKISIIDEDSLSRICVSSFKSDEIKRSKDLLFDSLPTEKKKISRKRLGKENRDVEDIISLFKGTDPEVMPVFVARDLEKLPPILFDHVDVSKLLKDLLIFKTELADIKSNYVTTQQLDELRTEMISKISTSQSTPPDTYRNIRINTRRGACLDSGPMGLSPYIDMTVMDLTSKASSSLNENVCSSRTYPQKPIVDSLSNLSAIVSPLQARQPRMQQISPEQEGTVAGAGPRGIQPNPTGRQNGVQCEPASSAALGTRQLIDDASACPCNIISPKNEYSPRKKSFAETMRTEGEWKTVQRHKPRLNYRYLGTMGSSHDKEGRFKAAENKIPIFITKVHKDSSEKDITEYVYNKTKERISLEKIVFRREKDHRAYKFLVSEEKVSLFLDDKLWPQGIIFRRFVHFKPRNVNGGDTVGGPPKYNV